MMNNAKLLLYRVSPVFASPLTVYSMTCRMTAEQNPDDPTLIIRPSEEKSGMICFHVYHIDFIIG